MSLQVNTILSGLQSVHDPLTGLPLGHKFKEKDLQIKGDTVTVRLNLGYFPAGDKDNIEQQVKDACRKAGAAQTEISYLDGIKAHAVQAGLKPIASIKNIIAVASGKGGVGKSTTSVNLALALAQSGAKVGILDADIYGPSQPLMLGVSGKPESLDGKSMEPLQAHGVYVNSIGFLIDPDMPAIWRGPMVTQALQQLLEQTNWPNLDYLVIDMPPGTGDIALTLAQKVPVVGAVIVTTPQDIALADARKGLRMFQKVNVPILGLVENMSMHVCSNCGHIEHLFGQDGGRKMAQELDVPWLGGLPLTLAIREQTDSGKPTVISDPDSEAAGLYRNIARKVAIQVSNQPVDMAGKFPSVVVKPL
ncbi:MAG: iron-sulfur cluster carrier protein ApbC [Alcaligenaceae bacterium]|nr:iron-sulfur cluster carrier protein ApbC [Alcaligenaceae bacterium]